MTFSGGPFPLYGDARHKYLNLETSRFTIELLRDDQGSTLQYASDSVLYKLSMLYTQRQVRVHQSQRSFTAAYYRH